MEQPQPHGKARYGVEQGTDGSWLVVDYGPLGGTRIAIARFHTQLNAHRDAETLSQLETLTSSLSPLDDNLERLLAETSTAIEADHTFNHLLPPQHP